MCWEVRAFREAGSSCHIQFVFSSLNSWLSSAVFRKITFLVVAVLVDAPYWVLGTDYDNYAVVWSCSNFGIFSTRKFPRQNENWTLTNFCHL